MLLHLEGLLNCLISSKVLMRVRVSRDDWVVIKYRTIGTCSLYRLIRPIGQIHSTLTLILPSIRPDSSSSRLWIFLPLVSIVWKRACICREISLLSWTSSNSSLTWMHLNSTLIAMKSNILICWTELAIMLIWKKITSTCWQYMDWIWIHSRKLIVHTSTRIWTTSIAFYLFNFFGFIWAVTAWNLFINYILRHYLVLDVASVRRDSCAFANLLHWLVMNNLMRWNTSSIIVVLIWTLISTSTRFDWALLTRLGLLPIDHWYDLLYLLCPSIAVQKFLSRLGLALEISQARARPQQDLILGCWRRDMLLLMVPSAGNTRFSLCYSYGVLGCAIISSLLLGYWWTMVRKSAFRFVLHITNKKLKF